VRGDLCATGASARVLRKSIKRRAAARAPMARAHRGAKRHKSASSECMRRLVIGTVQHLICESLSQAVCVYGKRRAKEISTRVRRTSQEASVTASAASAQCVSAFSARVRRCAAVQTRYFCQPEVRRAASVLYAQRRRVLPRSGARRDISPREGSAAQRAAQRCYSERESARVFAQR